APEEEEVLPRLAAPLLRPGEVRLHRDPPLRDAALDVLRPDELAHREEQRDRLERTGQPVDAEGGGERRAPGGGAAVAAVDDAGPAPPDETEGVSGGAPGPDRAPRGARRGDRSPHGRLRRPDGDVVTGVAEEPRLVLQHAVLSRRGAGEVPGVQQQDAHAPP